LDPNPYNQNTDPEIQITKKNLKDTKTGSKVKYLISPIAHYGTVMMDTVFVL
jgi:hypothetical protein